MPTEAFYDEGHGAYARSSNIEGIAIGHDSDVDNFRI